MTAHRPHNTSLADNVFGGAGRRRLAITAVALAAALAGNAATAHAATTENAASAAPAKNCVRDVSAPRDAQCFATFRAAIKYATDGRVANAPESATEAMADPGLAAELNQPARQADNFVLGVMYKDFNYRGGSFIWTGGHGCTDTTADDEFFVTSMPPGWDNVVSSLKGFSNCGMKLFEDPGFGGSSTGFIIRSPVLGAMNDQASSIRWS